MKILHMSDTGLPDARIERAARTSLKSQYEVFFCGQTGTSNTSEYEPFKAAYNLEWTANARLKVPIVWSRLKGQFSKILNDLRPDIIHAHNVCAAKLASEFEYPFVFDDHEHVSQELKAVSESDHVPNRKKYFSKPLIRKIWTSWENELAQNAPIITVSKSIAQDYQALGSNKAFVVPNLPNEIEIDKERQLDFNSRAMLLSAYSGKENTAMFMRPYRDMTGFVDLFNQHDIGGLTILGEEGPGKISPHVKYAGFLPRREMYNELSRHNIGLLPWKSHWFHRYCNPNKVYEYAHAGLYVMLTNDFTEVISMFHDNCATFRNHEELVEKLLYFKDHPDELVKLRQKTFAFARDNLFWEKYEDRILDAYKQA